MMSTQAKVAIRKQNHPEKYCPASKCLWMTNGGYCPRHKHLFSEAVKEAAQQDEGVVSTGITFHFGGQR
jgi:hypothetical protein